MPNHLDGALEFFDMGGTNLGCVRPQDHQTVMWEEAPGQPSTLATTRRSRFPMHTPTRVAPGAQADPGITVFGGRQNLAVQNRVLRSGKTVSRI
jgi:hypothetical protein